MTTTDITYTAHLGTCADAPEMLELVVRKDIVAGVSGPFVVTTFDSGTDLETIEMEMAQYELAVDGDWNAYTHAGGLRLSATLRML